MLKYIFIIRDKVSNYVSLIPFLFMLCNVFGFYIFVMENFYNANYKHYKIIYNLGSQLFDFSAIALILMFATSKNYKLLSWFSFSCLVGLWIVNTIYKCNEWEVDLYFLIFSLVIFITFVVITIASITNRIFN